MTSFPPTSGPTFPKPHPFSCRPSINPHPPEASPHHLPSTMANNSVLPQLRDMFQLLRENDWVHSFLFNSDPAHITCFTAPLLLSQAVTCTVSVSRFSKSHPHSPQHLTASFAFVPAFNVNSISAGFGLQQNDLANPSLSAFLSLPCQVSHEKELFRYIRDDAQGSLLMLHNNPEKPFLRLEYISHLSSTCRKRSFCLFDRNTFMPILKADPTLPPEALLSALTVIQTCCEYRDCPYCLKPHDAACACQLQLAAPRHNLDFGNAYKHISVHAGTFEGTAKLKQFDKGVITKQLSFTSRMELRGGSAPDFVPRLTKWALAQLDKDVPSSNAVLSAPITADATHTIADVDLPFLELDSLPSFQKQSAGGLKDVEGFGDEPIPFLKDVSIDFDTPSPDQSDLPDVFNNINFNAGPEEMVSHDTARIFNWPTEPLARYPVDLLDIPGFFQNEQHIVESEPPAKRARVLTDAQVEKCESAATTLDHEVLEANESSTIQRPTGVSNSVDPISKEEDAEEQKELRKKQKIIRNRIAARKSNAKKKAENDERKRLKKELQEEVVRLRAKEMRLRAENLRLRTMVKGKTSRPGALDQFVNDL